MSAVIVKIRKAQAGNPDKPIKAVYIHIDEEINFPVSNADLEKDLITLEAEFENDAEKLFQALKMSLPGGTLDRLLVKLLQYKSSLFVVTL